MNQSPELIAGLQEEFKRADLYRPLRVPRYENGAELMYEMTSVDGGVKAGVRLLIEKFVGGGFAGQVYKVRIIGIEPDTNDFNCLIPGNIYAVKILIPPSGFSLMFRNILYKIGFQGDFQLQCNPAAARSGALWQKFIRRAAGIRFGSEKAVVDIYATFVDSTLGSCGEISEWVDGRTWRLEVDDHMDLLSKWKQGKSVEESRLGSPEFRAKYRFMREFVNLLHETGAHEFARQYEWSTCKSQPNCLKRNDTEGSPEQGLTAVDFRAGLTLLPFAPMSPGDFMLILKGIKRGSLVQFDLGNIAELEKFISIHPEFFTDMGPMLEELKVSEKIYRSSVPDIAHNGFKFLYNPQSRQTFFISAVNGWRVRNIIDNSTSQSMGRNNLLILIFMSLGLIPILGGFIRKIWGQRYWRQHYGACLSGVSYLKRAIKGKAAETIIQWHRDGRTDKHHSELIFKSAPFFFIHFILSILPVGIHRCLTDFSYLKNRLAYIFIRPVRLYFDEDMREQWLRDMVAEGVKKRLLNQEDEQEILSQIKEPFIQKYLKSLAVHVCTMPITQVVSLITVGVFWIMNPEMSTTERSLAAAAILAAFQVVPLSPGSLVRGLYVLYLVIRERNFKDYNIAVFLSFFKYIGYLAFPIQMTYKYPTLARFMAGYWATEAVHIVPVFGEQGALLERSIFGIFYNWPLTIRRRMTARSEQRSLTSPKYWHIPFTILAAASVFAFADFMMLRSSGIMPGLRDIWWLSVTVPLLSGWFITLNAGGASFGKRIIGGALAGVFTGILYSVFSLAIIWPGYLIYDIIINGLWRIFLFTVLTVISLIITEILLPDKSET